jgi:glyoxylase-like metal-dependent hydrolase (beta-lactamase superfamily II)
MTRWHLEMLTVGPLQMNAYLLSDPAPVGSGEAILIDPGAEPQRLLAAIDASGCQLVALLATHGHFDHVSAAANIQAVWELPLICHPGDAEIIAQLPELQRAYGFAASQVPHLQPRLSGGQEIAFGGAHLRVAHVPGHSPGQVMFSWPGHAVVGDCLFAGSVGRTDLPGGDFDTLAKSIREHIYALPDSTLVHSGHGPDTSVGREKATNPFVRTE